MSAQKFFTVKGQTFMRVQPAEALTRSTMVKDVLKRGDQFVVNMNTGKLTILSGTTDVDTLPYTLSFPKQPQIGAKSVRTLSQLLFHIGNYRTTWSEYDMCVTVRRDGGSCDVQVDQNSDIDEVILMIAKVYENLKAK